MRVLYVEDDDNLAFAVEQMLKQDGHNCDRVRSGAGAVKLGQTNEYDVILLDVMLPDIDGYEVIRLLQGAGVDTPVLIQSGLVERDKAMDGLGFGVDDYLIKPFNRDELIRQVRQAASRSSRAGPSTANMLAVVGTRDAEETASETTDSVIALGDGTTPEDITEAAVEPVAEPPADTTAEIPVEPVAEAVAETAAPEAADEADPEAADEAPWPDSFPSLPAKIVADEGRIDIDCIVISVTSGGAVLNVYDELVVCPDNFKLAVAGDKSYRCQSCWRHGDKVGVKFV